MWASTCRRTSWLTSVASSTLLQLWSAPGNAVYYPDRFDTTTAHTATWGHTFSITAKVLKKYARISAERLAWPQAPCYNSSTQLELQRFDTTRAHSNMRQHSTCITAIILRYNTVTVLVCRSSGWLMTVVEGTWLPSSSSTGWL